MAKKPYIKPDLLEDEINLQVINAANYQGMETICGAAQGAAGGLCDIAGCGAPPTCQGAPSTLS